MAVRTFTRLYDSYEDATQVVNALEAAGVPHSDISIVASNANNAAGTTGTSTGMTSGDPEQGAETGAGTGATLGTILGGGAGLLAGIGALAIPGIGPIVAAGWLNETLTGAGVGAAAGGLLGSLTGAGVSEADANVYAEGVRRGGSLVTVRADEMQADRIEAILNGRTYVDPAARRAEYEQTGWRGYDATAAAPAAATAATTASTARMGTTAAVADTGDTVKVVEERLVVGKREVEQGGVRVHAHVVETPVEEQVSLHEERVTIERRPVNRPAVPGDIGTGSRTLEAVARAEEAVVAKEARVVEEIGIRKEATDRVETVRDSVRKTEVEVEDTTATTARTTGTTTVTDATVTGGTTGTTRRS